MPTPVNRRKVTMILPDDLLKRLLSAEVERDTRQAALDNILGAGVDLASETAVTYVQTATDAVTAAAVRYSECMQEVVALAKEKGGYNAGKCGPIQATNAETTGAVTWVIQREDEEGA